MSIVIIFAPPGTGKTVLLTHLAVQTMFDRARNKAMQLEIRKKQANGFDEIQTVPVHCVASNYDIVGHKFGCSPRYNRRINPFKLGVDNPYVKTHYNLPYEAIFITEAQKYLNSRMSRLFPRWQSEWYEEHRHNDLDIYLDTQRPMLIDVNIRELASFIEVVSLKKHTDAFGKIDKLVWTVRYIDNSQLFDKYMSSGKTDKSCYREDKITANYNVFNCYSSQSCKPKFYKGHFSEDYDLQYFEPTEETAEAYLQWLKDNDDELPDGYYIKNSA